MLKTQSLKPPFFFCSAICLMIFFSSSCQQLHPSAPERFISADIVRLVPSERMKGNERKTLGLTMANKLASYVPGLGSYQHAPSAGLWIEGFNVTFKDRSGSLQTIRMDPALTCWTEGYGDWQLDPRAREMILNAVGPSTIR